ncbi:MAG: hypothetical protein Q4E33_04025 [Erysipelotrichaceae bacterium]|nr:hypothetical protein [Erysipelotrichaceae bacterium]
MKKLLSVILTVLMALCVCTINIAAENEEIDEAIEVGAEIDDLDAELTGILGDDPTAKSELVFTGEEQELINPGNKLGFEYRYRIQGNDWTNNSSNIKATNVGEYIVEWQMKSILSPFWVRSIQELTVVIAESEEPEIEINTLQVMFANMTGYANEDGTAEFFISNYEELYEKLGTNPTLEYREGDTGADYQEIDYKIINVNGIKYPMFVIKGVEEDTAYQMQVKVENNEDYKIIPTAFQVKKTPLYLGLTDLEIDKGNNDIDASFVFSIKLRLGATNDSESRDMFALTINDKVIPDDAYTVDYVGDFHLDLSYDFLKITLTDDYVKDIKPGTYAVGLHMVNGQSRGESFNCYSTLTVKEASSISRSSSTSSVVNKETAKKNTTVRIVSTGVE